jgi:hypothetical protein
MYRAAATPQLPPQSRSHRLRFGMPDLSGNAATTPIKRLWQPSAKAALRSPRGANHVLTLAALVFRPSIVRWARAMIVAYDNGSSWICFSAFIK